MWMVFLTVRAFRIFAFFLPLTLAAGLSAVPAAGPPERVAVILQVEGAIGPASADYLARGLAQAAERGAALVLLRMDTPGGLDSSMREIIRSILTSPVPVATYVHPSGARAASAGTYILYASHIAAMTPGTTLGAATPVALGGSPLPGGREPNESEDGEERETGESPLPQGASERKVVNDAAAYIRGLANLRGRNAEWAEKAVREAASLSAHEALEAHVINLVARDLPDLLRQMDRQKVMAGDQEITLQTSDLELEYLDPDWRTRFLSVITNPNVALILMMIGIYGLIFEFMNPGALYPGTIGAISLLIGLYALAALPVNYAGFALIVLGIAFLMAEAFTPSLGVLGIGGAVALAIGGMILIDTDAPGFELSWPVIGGVIATSLAFSLIVARLALSSRRRKVVSGREEMIGSAAQVLDWGDGAGHVMVHGERWRAVSDVPLAPGRQVQVAGIDGLTLRVVPVEMSS